MIYKKSEGEPTALLISCRDEVAVQDRLTFHSYLAGTLRITHWIEETDDLESRLESMYDILFEDVMQSRGSSGTGNEAVN